VASNLGCARDGDHLKEIAESVNRMVPPTPWGAKLSVSR